jgi:predicted aminopeptidase
MRLKAAAFGIVLLPTLLASGCATGVGYLWKQGGYLLRDSCGARRITAVLRDPSTSPETRKFLEEVEDIKGYAVEHIGLRRTSDYTRYKKLNRNHLVDVVQACEALSFKAYYWRYPLLGRLPYKGFYELRDAEAEAERLKAEGYDVIVREVDAFSTLGFLSTPVYSFMGRYSIFDLSSTIIHEMTHATVFLKDEARFNEELATFVGDEGALEYIRSRFGPDSDAYRNAVFEQEDSALFLSFLKELSGALRTLYSGPLPREEKLAEKKRIIASYKKRYAEDFLPRFHAPAYRKAADLPINNAYISLYDLYTEDVPLLKRYFAQVCGSSLKEFMEQVKRLAKGGGRVAEKMRRELQRRSGS